MKYRLYRQLVYTLGRAPQGARGLKWNVKVGAAILCRRRAPQGARGLKSTDEAILAVVQKVAPRKGRVG